MNLIRRVLRSDRPPGEVSKLWKMSETAPFQVPICAYFFILAFVNMVTRLGLTPSSVDDTYPLWLVIPWAVATLIGSGMSLFGRYVEAYRLESSGLAFLLVACLIYIGAVFGINGINAAFAALAYVAIGTGCGIRMRVIARHHKAQRVAGEILKSENGDAL